MSWKNATVLILPVDLDPNDWLRIHVAQDSECTACLNCTAQPRGDRYVALVMRDFATAPMRLAS